MTKNKRVYIDSKMATAISAFQTQCPEKWSALINQRTQTQAVIQDEFIKGRGFYKTEDAEAVRQAERQKNETHKEPHNVKKKTYSIPNIF